MLAGCTAECDRTDTFDTGRVTAAAVWLHTADDSVGVRVIDATERLEGISRTMSTK